MIKKLLLAISLCAIGAFVVYAVVVNIRRVEPESPAGTAHLLQTASSPDNGARSESDAGDQFEGSGAGMAALRDASSDDKYTFAFFYKDEDDRTNEMRQVFETAMEKVADRAEHVILNASDPSEKDIVKKYGVDRSPMPLVLAVAPNGALTRGLPRGFDEKKLLSCFVSPCMEECLKAVQKTRLVAVCIQNESTQFNTEAMQGVQEFMADPRFANITDLVRLDPSNPDEATTCKRFGIDPKTDQAITLLLAPPGRVVGRFKGATNKDHLIAGLTSAKSGGCGPGCAPGSCGK
jgi:hypothetical protein